MKTFLKKTRKEGAESTGERWIKLAPASSERLKRLRSKIKGQTDEALVALALEYLERRTERLYKREMLRRIEAKRGQKAGKGEGGSLLPQQLEGPFTGINKFGSWRCNIQCRSVVHEDIKHEDIAADKMVLGKVVLLFRFFGRRMCDDDPS